jgi:hypothetical protein
MADTGGQDERRRLWQVLSKGKPIVPENYVVAREAVDGVRHSRLLAVFLACVGGVILAPEPVKRFETRSVQLI